jgi:aspartyl-tRNA(Asn)/glutamyl-tRNA(Gln) amidotransferase subunit A
VKDNMDVEGAPTTNGSLVEASLGPVTQDASLVRRLREQGAVIVGKTNLSELAFSGIGTNPHFGTPVNPLSTDEPLVTGGSSSGSAAAVAHGLVPTALGTDTSGSVRVPAAFCGVVGYKASEGRLPTDGVRTLSTTLDSLGVLTSGVDVLGTLSVALGLTTPASLTNRGEVVRLVVPDDDEIVAGCHPDVRHWFEAEVERLGELDTVTVERRPLPVLRMAQQLMDAHGTIVAEDAYRRFGTMLVDGRAAMMDPAIVRRLRAARAQGRGAARVRALRKPLGLRAARELAGCLLLCPTVRHGPPTIAEVSESPAAFDRLNASSLRTTMLLSYLGMPGVSLPCGSGRTSGFGLLVSAPHGADERVLQGALAVDDEPAHRQGRDSVDIGAGGTRWPGPGPSGG